MSRIRTNLITNRMANGAPTVSNGLVISGVTTSTNVSVASSVTATTFYGSGANLTSLPAQATIANNADNRVITGGSGVNLNGEANLTFDGTKVLNISSSAGGFFQGTDTDGGVGLVEMGNGNVAIQADTGNAISNSKIHFYVDNSEKMILDDSGRLLLGTQTEGAAGADELTIATTGSTGLTIRSGTSNDGNIFFSDATSGTGEYAGYIQFEHANNALRFGTLNTERLRITSSGALLLQPSTGSIAELSAGGTNTDLRVTAVGSGGFFDVATNGSGNRIRVDGNGHFYQNQQRTRLTYGAASACSLRWNITSGKNLTQNNSNRDNYGKLNIQAGRANSTTVNDDCTAIRITPAEVRATAVGTKSSGIGFMHLNADQWPEYSGNQAWMGLSLNDTSGQERDRFEIHMNSQTGQGSQPNNLAMRIYPSGEITRPNQPSFAAYRNVSSYSLNNEVFPFNATRHNNGNHFNTGNYRFTAPVAGRYMFTFHAILNTQINSGHYSFRVNNSTGQGHNVHFTTTNSHWDHVSSSQIMSLNANDYVTMWSNSNVGWHGNGWQIFCGELLS